MANPERQHDDLPTVLAELHRLTDEARTLAEQSQPGTVVATRSASPDIVKTQVAEQRAVLIHKMTELKAQRDALETHLRREMAAAHAALEPMRKHVARLEEMVWTVNLYLGRDEEITTLLDGAPAPAATPICVRQMVLSMDEESTIAADQGGMDFRDLTTFDAWVTEPEHLQQVLPELRGVVVLVPRRHGRDYGDPLVTAKFNEENRRSYWLIRNGDRLFRMSTDFPVGHRLTPTREEFQTFFTESRFNPETSCHERVPLEPGSSAWLRAEEAADIQRRHYMRAALILQGLIDRTTVFAPLPDPQASVLRPESYDAGHVRLICDAENTITTGLIPFYQWLAERNQTLRPGMRVVGAFNSEEFSGLRSREAGSYGEHERLRPPRTNAPSSGDIHVIEDRREDGGLVIRYGRTDEVYTRDRYGYTEYRAPQVRASCVLYPTDKFVLPIDLVTIEEMRQYINSRTERHTYAHMLPLLLAAIGVKQAERAAEAPFLKLLAAQIALTYDVDPVEATAAVPELVTWWKHTTWHYRPLIKGDDPDTEARAVKAITNEFAARRYAAQQAALHAERDAGIVARLREEIPDALLIARPRSGGYLVLTPQPRSYPEAIAARNLYVQEHKAGTSGRVLDKREWVIPARSRIDRWTILWSSTAWENWNLAGRKAINLTDPEITHLIERLREHAAAHSTIVNLPVGRCSELTGTPVLISCHTDLTGRAALRCYLDHGQSAQPPQRLLTERIPSAYARMLRLNWHRGVGAAIDYDINERAYDKGFDTRRPWDTDEIRPPWHEETVLWSAPEVQRLHQQARTIREAEDRAAELRGRARKVIAAVRDAWEARAEQAAYARFLDDYRDPGLWEGHRKTLTGLQFPYHHHRGLSLLLNRLVEDGHDLDGHTVETAVTLLDEDVPLPDDILDLPLTRQPTEEATASCSP
jgi:hypothetical protein